MKARPIKGRGLARRKVFRRFILMISSSANSDSSRYTTSRDTSRELRPEMKRFEALMALNMEVCRRNYRSPKGLGYRANSGFIENFSTKRHLQHIDSMFSDIRHGLISGRSPRRSPQIDARSVAALNPARRMGNFVGLRSSKEQEKLAGERPNQLKSEAGFEADRNSWRFPNPATRIRIRGYAEPPY